MTSLDVGVPEAGADERAAQGALVPARARAVRRRGDRRQTRLVLGILGLAMLPFVVAVVALFVSGNGSYLPTGDRAMIEALVSDVASNPPLVGLYSRDNWSHPGPLQFYLLAPFYWLSGGSSVGINLGALVINGASLAGVALIARRRGGLPLTLITVIASGLLMRTLGGGFIHDPWNNFLPVFPFALLIFLAWSMAAGERWALPVAVFVASFLAQAHVGFVVLATPVLAWGIAWLGLTWLKGSGRGGDLRVVGDGLSRLRPLLAPGLAAMAILVVVWLPPVIDVVANAPSNPKRLLSWFGNAEGGVKTVGDGIRVLAGQFSAVPEWLTNKRDATAFGESPFLQGPFPRPVLLLPVAAAAAWLWRSGRAERRHIVALLGLVLVAGVIAVARTVGLAFDYRLRWTWVPPMLALVIVAWAGWLALTRWRPGTARPLGAGAVALMVAISGVNTVTAARSGNPEAGETDVIATIGPQVMETLDSLPKNDGGVVLVTEPFHQAATYSRGLAWYLERRDVPVRVEPTLALQFGQHRVYDGEPLDAVLTFRSDRGIDEVEPGLRLVASWESPSARLWQATQQRHQELAAALENGEINEAEYFFEARALPSPRSTARFAQRVAVYLDSRRPVEPHLSIGHSSPPPG
jgi:hypothetical protein